ncbi:DUF2147 domain-containing protein [Marimonas arenosa]|uniref:DUF2147 domain-containing protein n=1 Tax=Marimonas arenosa TaxID=1795305 RepID=A0AAE4B5J0_9RHOB|nr:DUF2147 domain-containing protein [Marimonas arenosa]MDQ2089301.1 DUF2147 domain-containing protein [Marimonas arenosa]
MRLLLTVLISSLSLPALAETAAGTWLTGPDKKGQVGHIRLAPCGSALCGTVLKAFDKAGREVVTPNVGKRVIWDVKPLGSGTYAGRMYVSMLDKNVNGEFRVAGQAMTVKGCLGPICQTQKWRRID